MGVISLLVALSATILSSLCLALLLRTRARDMEGAGLLAAFLVSVAVFLAGESAPLVWGQAGGTAAALTFASAPIGSALFVHFLLVFLGVAAGRWMIAGLYATALLGTGLCLGFGAGGVQPWNVFPAFFLPDIGGWAAVVAAMSLRSGDICSFPRAGGLCRKGAAVRRRRSACPSFGACFASVASPFRRCACRSFHFRYF